MSEPPTIDEYEAIINRLLDRAVAAEDQLRKIRQLFASGPDTPCRTTWRREPLVFGSPLKTECVEVPMEDLREALDPSWKNPTSKEGIRSIQMPLDKKYGRVILENQRNVGDNEPVVVFRAKDRLLPQLLVIYRIACELAGSPDNHLAAIDDTAADIKAWQVQNGSKTPDSVGYDPRA